MNDFARPHHMSGTEYEGVAKVHYSAGLDDGLLVDFYSEEVYMEAQSKELGSPIFQSRIFTRIRFPGDSKKVVVHPCKGVTYQVVHDDESGEFMTDWSSAETLDNGDPSDPVKYPKAWARFMKRTVTADAGLPLEEWGAIPRSMAASLKSMDIHTVEALAKLSDVAVQNIMGGNKYRDLAKAHLDERERTRILASAQETADRSNARVNEQQGQIDALKAEVMKLQTIIASTGGTSRSDYRAPPSDDLARFNESDGKAMAEARRGPQTVQKMSAKELKAKHKIPGKEEAA